MSDKKIFYKLINYLTENEETSYHEHLREEFPEIEEEDYYEVFVYGRDDMNHIFAYTLQARDYLSENET